MKKPVFLAVCFLIAGAVFGQNYNNGPLDSTLPWGSSVSDFQQLYPRAREITSDNDTNKNIRRFSQYIDPMQGITVDFLFCKDRFYQYTENRGRMSPDSILYLIMRLQSEFGRFDDYKEIKGTLFGNFYYNYIHYSDTLTIIASTNEAGGTWKFFIDYEYPEIIKELEK